MIEKKIESSLTKKDCSNNMLEIEQLRFHLEAAVERRNLLREARRSEDGERVACRADSGGRAGFAIPPVSS